MTAIMAVAKASSLQ